MFPVTVDSKNDPLTEEQRDALPVAGTVVYVRGDYWDWGSASVMREQKEVWYSAKVVKFHCWSATHFPSMTVELEGGSTENITIKKLSTYGSLVLPTPLSPRPDPALVVENDMSDDSVQEEIAALLASPPSSDHDEGAPPPAALPADGVMGDSTDELEVLVSDDDEPAAERKQVNTDVYGFQRDAANFKEFETDIPIEPMLAGRLPGLFDATTATPLQFFRLLFTDDIVTTLVTETNRYAEQQQRADGDNPSWKRDVSRKEILVWVGLIIATSLFSKMPWPEYWRNDTSSIDRGPHYGRFMGSTRFKNILRYLHFADNNTLPQRDGEGFRRCQKVWPVMKLVLANIKAYYRPGRHLSLDEARMASRHHFALTFNASKPDKYAVEFMCINCAKTGYMLYFHMREGASAPKPYEETGRGKMDDLVSYAISTEAVGVKRGQILYMDRAYTSIGLVHRLRKDLGIGVVGTIMRNRKGFPAERFPKSAARGRSKLYVSRDGLVVAGEWQDTQSVAFAASVYGCATENVRRKGKDGIYSRVRCPVPLARYNENMGGADSFDSLVAHGNILKGVPRVRKAYKKIFYFMLSICMANAYILYRTFCGRPLPQQLTHRQFIRSVASALANMNTRTPRSSRATTPRPFVETQQLVTTADAKALQCVWCSSIAAPAPLGQRKERKRSSYWCACCGLTLCKVGGCSRRWHDSNQTASDKFQRR